MSLIQEALKRQQKEYGNGKTHETPSSTLSESPVTETIPVTEPPAPKVGPLTPKAEPPVSVTMPPPPPLSAKLFKPWMMIGGIVAIAVVVLMVGGMTVVWILKMARKKAIPALMTQVQMPDSGAGMPMPGTEPDSVQGAELVVSQPAPKSSFPTAALPQLPSLQDSVPSVPLTSASKDPLSSLPSVSETAGGANIPVVNKSLEKKAPPVPLQWPTLKLTGLLSSLNAGEGAARINNQMVFIGGQIEGVTLIKIGSDGIYLKYGDETRFLKVGGVLY